MVFLLGSSGYVGAHYADFLKQQDIPFWALSRTQYDYSRRDILEQVIDQYHPSFIINAAGYTGKPNVDASEHQKLKCLKANTVLPAMIAEVCAEKKIPWGHVSSGCIYSGAHPDGSGFSETDPPNFDFRHNNCSFYSGTKALAEEIIVSESQQFYIWRLRIPFNHENNPRNYLAKLMHYKKLVDVRNSISHLDEFIRATWECWTKKIPYGIYNVTNPGSVTTREVADLIKKHGLASHEFSYFKDEAEFLRVAAITPRANCVMDSSKLIAHGIHLTEVHEALEQSLRNWS
jgi:dTDP-4-dehydrorhamnose reductase